MTKPTSLHLPDHMRIPNVFHVSLLKPFLSDGTYMYMLYSRPLWTGWTGNHICCAIPTTGAPPCD